MDDANNKLIDFKLFRGIVKFYKILIEFNYLKILFGKKQSLAFMNLIKIIKKN